MSKSRSRFIPILLVVGMLAAAGYVCQTPTEEQQIATEIALLEATRGALSTEVAGLEVEATSEGGGGSSVRTATPTALPPSPTPTKTPTPVPPTPTPTPVLPKLSLTLLGCTTGLDLAHGLGEVTNAYVEARNEGRADATNVCVRLDATDLGKAHPDEVRCVPHLPARTRVRLKLTVDTEFQVDTAIVVSLTADQATAPEITSADCAEPDLPLRREIEATLDIIEPLASD